MRAFILVFPFVLGCTSYRFGPPPPPPPPSASALETCVAARRLTLSSSQATTQLMNDVSSDGTYLYSRGRSMSDEGYTFYRGQERLDVDDGLQELGDPALKAEYERAHGELSGAKTRVTISRPLWITLMSAGLVVTLVGITQLKADGGGIDRTGLILTGAGLGAELLAIPFLYLDRTSSDEAAAYDLRTKIYTPGGDEKARITTALESQRQRVERSCAP